MGKSNTDPRKAWLAEAKFVSWWLTFDDFAWPHPELTRKWKERAAAFQQGGANAVVMFGFHFRFDYTGYFDRVFGVLREISLICRDHGLRVVEHHSPTLVHRARGEADRRDIRERNFHHVPFYPDSWENQFFNGQPMADWRQISARDNQPVFFERYTCECFCPNHPGFQQACLDYAGRHLEAVPVDAWMSDDLHYLPDVYSCACRHCRDRFRDEEGLDLPPGTDRNFWENTENPDYLRWIAARYRWNTDHYRRLRAFLPEEIALWGCASDVLAGRLTGMGFAPQHYAAHWDAVFHEIYHLHQPGTHDADIASDLAGFASVARHYDKPLIALFYAKSTGDVPRWLETTAFHRARPWLSSQPRDPEAVREEALLANGYAYDEEAANRPVENSVELTFSVEDRDRLGAAADDAYVTPFRQRCHELVKQGKIPHIRFTDLE